MNDEILQDFHASGVYDIAHGLGILPNAEGKGLEGSQLAPQGTSMASDSQASLALINAVSASGKGVPPAQQIRSGQKRPIGQRDGDAPDVNDAGKLSPKRKQLPQRPTRQPGDKGGKGLRHFSMKVCEKVESKGRTSYNEVADELVSELQNPDEFSVEGPERFDEKNIRRRVYDALNVLMAMNIIAKEKKEIMWKGLPATETDEEHARGEKIRIATRIERKKAYLQDLEDQLSGLQSLVRRNEARPRGLATRCIQLPFLLVKTKPQATVELEIAEDEQLVHFDFNSTPFEIQDENNVLRQMGLHSMGLEHQSDATAAAAALLD